MAQKNMACEVVVAGHGRVKLFIARLFIVSHKQSSTHNPSSTTDSVRLKGRNMSEKQQRLVLSIIEFLDQSIKDGTVREEDKESLEVAGTFTFLRILLSFLIH